MLLRKVKNQLQDTEKIVKQKFARDGLYKQSNLGFLIN